MTWSHTKVRPLALRVKGVIGTFPRSIWRVRSHGDASTRIVPAWPTSSATSRLFAEQVSLPVDSARSRRDRCCSLECQCSRNSESCIRRKALRAFRPPDAASKGAPPMPCSMRGTHVGRLRRGQCIYSFRLLFRRCEIEPLDVGCACRRHVTCLSNGRGVGESRFTQGESPWTFAF